MERKPLHEIMAEMLSGEKLTEADNVVGKTDTTIKVDKDVKDPNQEAIDTANIIKSAPTREDPNKDTSKVDDEDVDGLADGILVITDPEITSEEFEEVADELQGIVDKSDAGEVPFTDKYKGDYILSCPICGGTFVNDTLLDSGEDVCPICCKVPDAFVVTGKIEDAGNVAEKEEVQDDIEQEENTDEPVGQEETETSDIPAPDNTDDLELNDEEDTNKKESKSISGNKLQESKDDEEDKDDEDKEDKEEDEDVKIETEKDAIDFLVNDEEEAIKGYETILDKLDDLDIENKDLYKEKIAEIIADEKDHIEILKGLGKGEDVSDEDLDNKEELEEGKEMEVNAGNIKRKAQEILPAEDIDVHDGDLYLKVSDKSTELVNQMKDKDCGLLNKFKSHIDGQMWYEIPFANMEDDYKEKMTEDNAVNDKGCLTHYIGKPDEKDYVGTVWENNKVYTFDVYKVGDKYVDANGYEVEEDKIKQLEKKTEDYDEDDTRNKEPINPEDKEYYNGKLWQVRVWCGAGYQLNYFNVYHDGEDMEDLLCKVVAYAEKNEDEILLSVDSVMEDINTMWQDEFKEWAEDNGEDEFQFATDYLDLVYVDATSEGASQPYFIRGENLAVLDHDMNESKLEESVSEEKISKASELGKKAFENGIKRVPAQDSELVSLLDDTPIGDGGKILDAWLDAWDKANVEKPVEDSKKVEEKEIKTESKLVWQSSDDGDDEEGFWEWLEDSQNLDDQIQERIFDVEEQTGEEATEEDVEQIRNEIADGYREEYYEMLNEQLMEDWENSIKPMIENQLDVSDTLVCMGTANTWNRSGSAYKICNGVSDLQDIMANYDYIALKEDETGLCMEFAHHDGTHYMNLYTLASTFETIFETLYDKQSSLVTEYEDFDEYLSEHYEEDILEELLDNAQDNQEVIEKVLKPLVNLL